ncbi:MAG: alcohol dehydrogenase catalytic domain-containing protein [Actinobacteria bacterium]|nr:alcohol dehydrogenase catalytic domain-containing protein [Actinomycetota bacterium]
MEPQPSTSHAGLDRVRRYLEEHGVAYELTEHPVAYTAAGEARAAGSVPADAAKTVMLRADGAYRMAVVPASEHVDLHKLREQTGEPSLRLASEQELAHDFGDFEVGALPPFGPLLGVRELVDRRTLARGRVLCNGGDHRHSVAIDAHDLLELTHPEVVDIVEQAAHPIHGDRISLATAPPRTMQAYQLVGWQQPPELREVPVPAPGPGEVLLKVAGAGACHSDLHLTEWPAGQLPFDPPFTLGHENAGWVERLGAGVTGLREGDAVLVYGPWGCGRCAACRRSSENYCERAAEIGAMGGGLGRDGGMAEYLLVPAARLLLALGELDPREAAPLTDAALTPYHAIKRSLHKLGPGSHAVVIGAGGLGHMAIELLDALCPARVVAVDLADDKLALAREVGAAETVRADAEDAVEQVRAATRGRGAELVLDLVGSDATLRLAAACGRSEGDLALVGLAGGTYPLSFFAQAYELSVATTYWGSAIELMEVIELAHAGKIRAHVERFPLERVGEAYAKLRAGEVEGRAVVCPHG